jgi:uncharacterized Zn-binding protein involved in type VI secretion
MPAVCRDKDLAYTGHTCIAICPIIAKPSRVFVNGKRIARPGDPLAPHTILNKAKTKCIPHPAFINKGSSTVFAHGIPVTRVGDSADQGAMIKGSNNVFAGGSSGGGGLGIAGAVAGGIIGGGIGGGIIGGGIGGGAT